MPHVIVKLYPGRSESQKKELAARITKNVVEIAECEQKVVSVAFEEINPENWPEKVYKPDIMNCPGKLYKEPGYNPFDTEAKEEDKDAALMAFVGGAADVAAAEDTSGYFNPMSWLDLELEDNPQSFDKFFDTPWDQLSDDEKSKRAMTIRRVL